MKRRYVVCGVSIRAVLMWIPQICQVFYKQAELVGMLDIDPKRFEVCRQKVPETAQVPTYFPNEFDRMIAETHPDAVLVACTDCYHVDYIVRALRLNLDVVSEKPLTTCWEDAIKVREAEKVSQGQVICAFNFRYPPQHKLLREMMLAHKVGRITHIDLNWYIDIRHGSSYFHRWNRLRAKSGSLSIHKASHHFDLINWIIGCNMPQMVHAFGALNHYGPNAPFNPSQREGRHCSDCTERRKCAYMARWETRSAAMKITGDHLDSIENAELLKSYSPEIYRPDKCLFDREIDIQDTIIADIKYQNGVLLNYSANFSTPYEGYRMAINGTHGRIEAELWGGGGSTAFSCPRKEDHYVDYYPIFGSRERIAVKPAIGGHNGGDLGIAEDVFLGVDPDRQYDILGNSQDGLAAIAIGDAVYKSITQNKVIDLTEVMQH